MARPRHKSHVKSPRAKVEAAAKRQAQRTHVIDAAMQADLDRRKSGAAGGHASSGVTPRAAAGRKTKMGSRSARNNAAVRDYA